MRGRSRMQLVHEQPRPDDQPIEPSKPPQRRRGVVRAAAAASFPASAGRRGVRSVRRARLESRPEVHLSHRSNWLRAAVLGANDGILSTASLVLGVAASGASGAAIVTAGIAGLVAGALSMAAGEYVSVSSQRDAEQADIRLEERELRRDPDGELRELAGVYEQRGLPPALASEVARPCRAVARWRRTPATSWASTSSGWRGRFRPRGRRRCRSRRVRRCRCWPSRRRRHGRGSAPPWS